MILETEVWCSEDDDAKDMGLPDGDVWMPIAIDMDEIDTIKDMDYRSVVKIWKDYNQR